MTTKIERRVKIKYRVRNKVSGTTECPRMSVFRSNKQIYVQIIDDLSGKTLAAASSLGLTDKVAKKEQSVNNLARGYSPRGGKSFEDYIEKYIYHLVGDEKKDIFYTFDEN